MRRRRFSDTRVLPAALLLGLLATPAVAQSRFPSDDGAWSSAFVHPEWRSAHCSVYDPVRQRMLVFAGNGPGGSSLGVVWSLSLTEPAQWTPHTVAGTAPNPRWGATAIYDPVRDRIVMFGGSGSISPNGEVWALSLTGTLEWTELEISGAAPPARALHSAIYDPVRDRMIVFGGRTEPYALLSDVWALDFVAGEWTEIVPTVPGPSPREDHAATYDALADRMIVACGEGEGEGFFDDSWELDLSGAPAWTLLATPDPLMNRMGHSLLYDTVDDQAVLIGGRTRHQHGGYGDSYVVWVLPRGAKQWTYLPFVGYIGANRAPAIYDAAHGRVVAYNGWDAMDIPVVDFKAVHPWGRPLIPRPVQRHDAVGLYDPIRDRMLFHGGRNPDAPMDDVWEFSLDGPQRWSLVETEGPAYTAEGHSAIYDPVRDRLLMLGGARVQQWSETWELTLEGTPTWRELSFAGPVPEQRSRHVAIYDPGRDRMIVHGGYFRNGASFRGETWALELAGDPVWTPLPEGPVTWDHAAVYDPVGDRMLVLGGQGQSLDQVWSLGLTAPEVWTLVTVAGEAPRGRTGATAIYDPVRHRVVFYGGCCWQEEDSGDDQNWDDVWELTLTGSPQWRRLAPTGAVPPGRRSPGGIYDPKRDRMVVHGGDGPDDAFFVDTWTLTWGEPARPDVACADIEVPVTPLPLRYEIVNPLGGARAVEWRIESARDWPGFPIRGSAVVAGNTTHAVELAMPLPEGSFHEPNTLTLTSWLSGGSSNDASCTHVVEDVETATLITSALADAEPGRVVLRWGVHDPQGTARVQRRGAGEAWRTIGTAVVASAGVLAYEDLDVRAGATYDYRLELAFGDDVTHAGDVRVAVPMHHALALARAWSDGAALTFVVALATADAAKLECFDVGGRRLLVHDFTPAAAGRHEIRVESSAMPPGVYLARLTQGSEHAGLRLVIVR